jgi:hypothetical protein
MKRPQFRLWTLFVVVALASVPMAWVAYQLNWIRQRHEFYSHYQISHMFHDGMRLEPLKSPWSLRLFGESPRGDIDVLKEFMPEAKRLFPEASVHEAFLGWGEKWPGGIN